MNSVLFKRLLKNKVTVLKIVLSIVLISIFSFVYLFLVVKINDTNKMMKQKYQSVNIYECSNKVSCEDDNIDFMYTYEKASYYLLKNDVSIDGVNKDVFTGIVSFFSFDNAPKDLFDLIDNTLIGKKEINRGEILISYEFASLLSNNKEDLIGKTINVDSNRFIVDGELTARFEQCSFINSQKIVGIFDEKAFMKDGYYSFFSPRSVITSKEDFSYKKSNVNTRICFKNFMVEDLVNMLVSENNGIYYGENVLNQIQLLEKESTFTKKILYIIGVMLLITIVVNLFLVIRQYYKKEAKFQGLLNVLGMKQNVILKMNFIFIGTIVFVVNFIVYFLSKYVADVLNKELFELDMFSKIQDNPNMEVVYFVIIFVIEVAVVFSFFVINYFINKKENAIINIKRNV